MYRRGRGRRYKRRQKRRKKYVMSRSLALPLPNSWKGSMRYFVRITLDPSGTLGADVHVFRANGPYDPSYTGVGAQPRGYDQMALFYNHVTVIGSKISATFTSASASNEEYICGIATRASNVAKTTAFEYQEAGNCKWKYLMQGHQGGPPKVVVTQKYNNTFLFGPNTKGQVMNPEIRSSTGAAPTEQAWWHVFTNSVDESTDNQGLNVSVLIHYICVWTEPNVPPQST